MRKTLILAAATLALAAMAAPAGASAETSHWKMGGVELEEPGTVTFTGYWSFLGGMRCHLHIHAELEAGTGTGKVTEFSESECELTETLAATCTEVTSVTPEGLPWMLDDEGSRIKVSGIKEIYFYEGGAFCPLATIVEDDEEGGGMFITPDSTEAMQAGTFSGYVDFYGTQEPYGGVEISANSGTYGL